MTRKRPGGAISIFLACVLLTLIVFSCTIVDITRVQIAKIQAERALQLASQSILASYNSQLQSQYGIFAKDFSSTDVILSDLKRYTESSLIPKTLSTTSNSYSALTNPISPGFTLYDPKVSIQSLSDKGYLINPEIARSQMIDFMEYRAPYTAIEPFLDKLGVLKKASKTAEVLQQKEEVVSEIQTLEAGFYELEMLVDGLVIDGAYGTLVTNSDDTPYLHPNYVKKLYTRDQIIRPIYNTDEIPLQSYCDALNQDLWFVDDTLHLYQNAVTASGDLLENLILTCVTLSDVEKQIDTNNLAISELSQTLDQLLMQGLEERSAKAVQIQMEIDALEEKGSHLLQQQEVALEQYSEGVNQFNNYNQTIQNDYHPQLQQLTSGYAPLEFKLGLKGIVEAALLQIEKIRESTPAVTQQITSLKTTLNNHDDLYIEETCVALLEEVEGYEKILGLQTDGSMDIVSNLSAMEDALKNNLSVLNQVDTSLSLITSSTIELQSFWHNQIITGLDLESQQKLLQDLHFDSSTQGSSMMTEVNFTAQLDTIESQLDNYNRELFFDYGQTGLTLPEGFDYEAFVKTAEEMFPGIDLPQMFGTMDDDQLPSHILGISAYKPFEKSSAISNSSQTEYLQLLKIFENGLTDEFIQLKDSLYMNEYILGMFKSATDHLSETMTINQFPKSTHYLNYECEYVLFGHEEDVANLTQSVATIFGIRIAFNLIALLADYEKMNTIKGISSAVAGWWSLGIGSILVTVLLTLIWSMMESVSDVERLLKGERIPILKNSDTWQTDLLTGATKAVQKSTDQPTSKEYLPSLSYNDYIRMLLMTPIADDTAKSIRVLDLIQENLSKERNESIHLANFVASYQVEATFEVNTLFFQLPFMPQRAQNQTTFTFNHKVRAAY
ncbi:MAG: hypothetical protein H7X94_10105 [Vallitaleaceae bacterium]|nr:hypothetical protein [Vallitaleaceae bacterium]